MSISGCSTLVQWPAKTGTIETTDPLELKLGLARRAERAGALTEARATYMDMVEGHPEYGPALHRLGVVSVKLDEIDTAVKYLERAATAMPESSIVLGDLGYAYYLKGDLDEALSTLGKALERDPTDKRIINNQAVVLGHMGKTDECLETFRRANNEAEALANVGFVLSQRGDTENAKRYFHRALDLNPELRTAAKGLLDFYQAEKVRSNTVEREPVVAVDETSLP